MRIFWRLTIIFFIPFVGIVLIFLLFSYIFYWIATGNKFQEWLSNVFESNYIEDWANKIFG